MPMTVYARGSFGAWMEQKIKNLQDYMENIRTQRDGDVKQWQELAAVSYTQLSLMQKAMKEGNLDLNAKIPKGMMTGVYQEAAKLADTPEFTEPFTEANLEQSMDLLGAATVETLSTEQVLQNLDAVRDPASQKEWQERQAEQRKLAEEQEKQKLAEEQKKRELEEEQEKKRLEEEKRLAEEQEKRRLEEEQEKQRQADAERQRKEAYQKELLENATKLKNQQEEDRKKKEAEDTRKREAAEREKQRKAAERKRAELPELTEADKETAGRVNGMIENRPARRKAVQERANQYPKNSYGEMLQNLTNDLQEIALDLQKMTLDPEWRKTYNESLDKADVEKPDAIKKAKQLQTDAGITLAKMHLFQEDMNNRGLNLMSPMPEERNMFDKSDEAAYEFSQTPKNATLFHPKYIGQTMEGLHLNWLEPPTPENVLLPYGELLGDRNKTIETAKAAQEKAEKDRKARKAPAKSLLEELKATTQKSFAGKLKSWFVGNSKEYNTAFNALKDVSEGRGDPNKAKDAIKKYLDLRGNKIRDHQYGRDRFDAMLKGLALVSTPREFMNACEQIEDSRLARTNGKDVDRCKIDVTRYLSSKELEEAAKEQKERDIKNIMNDKDLPNRDFYNFFNDLNSLKNGEWNAQKRSELKQFMQAHPCVREAAREISERDGLNLNVPKVPDGLDWEQRNQLNMSERNARNYAGLTQTQETQRSRREGPQMTH